MTDCSVCTFDQPHTHDIGWVEGDWKTVKAGDVVRVVRQDQHGDTDWMAQGRVIFRPNWADTLWLGDMAQLKDFQSGEYQLFVQAAPNPQLPTKQQSVISWRQDGGRGVAMRVNNGWHIAGLSATRADAEIFKFIKDAKIEVLAPVSETARQVLDRVSTLGDARPDDWATTAAVYRGHLRAVAAEFGVTDA